MTTSRTLTYLLAASLLGACANPGAKAPKHIAALEPRHVAHFVALEATANLTGGVNGPNAFLNKDGSIYTFTLDAVHPDTMLASKSFHYWQHTLESFAPVLWSAVENKLLY